MSQTFLTDLCNSYMKTSFVRCELVFWGDVTSDRDIVIVVWESLVCHVHHCVSWCENHVCVTCIIVCVWTAETVCEMCWLSVSSCRSCGVDSIIWAAGDRWATAVITQLCITTQACEYHTLSVGRSVGWSDGRSDGRSVRRSVSRCRSSVSVGRSVRRTVSRSVGQSIDRISVVLTNVSTEDILWGCEVTYQCSVN